MGLLRSEGAQLSMKDKAGDTPLLYAAKAGQLDAVEMVFFDACVCKNDF